MLKKSIKNAWAKKASEKVVFVRCAECGKLMPKTDAWKGADNKYYCEEHFDKLFVICDGCNDVFPRNEVIEVDGKFYCEDCFDEEYVLCYDCDKIIRRDEALRGADDELYCEDCFYDTFTYCENCNSVVYKDDTVLVHADAYEYDDSPEIWCEDCAKNNAYHCVHCDEYFKYWSDGENTVDGWVDHSCLEGNYVQCCECGDWIPCDDSYSRGDNDYCEYCWNNREDSIIYDYHDGPRPKNWHGSSCGERPRKLNVGVELEICNGGEDDDNARQIIKATGFDVDESFVCEHDSSLDNGFEIISSTATVDYHIKHYGWDKLMAKAIELGYTSHGSGCAGLHVHLDRKYFDGAMDDPQKLLTIIVVNNMEWLKKFSRRNRFNYCAFPEAHEFKTSDFKPCPVGTANNGEREILDTYVNFMRGHGACLNFCGYSTLEVRFNRGTLKFSTFVATMQFIQMLADFAKKTRIDRACNIHLRHFVVLAKVRHYDEFLNYLVERDINF